MGSTVSKATPTKQGLDDTPNYGRQRGSTVGCENGTKADNAKKRILLPVLLQRDDDDQKAIKKKKKGKKHNVKSISVKRNAKYKRITKSIIGRPANFQHMGHIGGDQPRMTVHPDDELLAEQLRDITARVNGLLDDEVTISVSPSTPTPTPTPTQQNDQHPENYQKPQRVQRNMGPPPPPPAHWSSLALRQAMRRQQLQDVNKPAPKVASMKRRHHPGPAKKPKHRPTGRRPRPNHVSPNALGMPPSLRLGPAR